jgi:hypothetical protein
MSPRTIGLALALAAALPALPAAAESNCRPEPVTATGAKLKDIEAATKSAMEAVKAKAAATLGPGFVLGPRRSATFTCVKWLGGPAARIGWECTLQSQVCKVSDGT